MKNIILSMLMIGGSLTTFSCHHDSGESDKFSKSDEIKKLYRNKIIGDWFYEDSTSLDKYYSLYSFNEEGSLKNQIKWIVREETTVDGKSILGDWHVKEDTTYIGKWDMAWSSEDSSPYIIIDVERNGTRSLSFRHFEYTESGLFLFQDWVGDLHAFSSRNTIPSF